MFFEENRQNTCYKNILFRTKACKNEKIYEKDALEVVKNEKVACFFREITKKDENGKFRL